MPRTISQDEFPEHLSFDVLRREAIGHLGELSGHIWTDHNVHDPGITIMELLIFSVMDLGYRTQLPIEDLIAANPDGKTEQGSFFSPAQILSNNPTTILDYRKMLVDIPHIKNAWLERAAVEVPISLAHVDESEQEETDNLIELNGLYKVLIQLEDGFDLDSPAGESLVKEVKDRLHAHRNLGEDFTEICFLCECKITFCIDVEISQEAEPNEVFVQITTALQDHLCPPIPFYTLQELLDQGVPMEEIFEGRPYDLESHGFTKSQDVLDADYLREIHVSDLYKIISAISDVKHINTLKIKPCHDDQENDCEPWVVRLPQDHVPVFCTESSIIQFKKNQIIVSTDPKKVRKFKSQTLKVHRKATFLDKNQLDKKPPTGTFRSDLSRYYSIQNDLPRIYGIQEGGLAANASDQRKAQALQLQSFLLFFDRLFIGYLTQLSQVGKIFSLDPEERMSVLETDQFIDYAAARIPEVEKLVKFYRTSKDVSSRAAETIAYPVELRLWRPVKETLEADPMVDFHLPRFDFQSIRARSIIIQQFRREFSQREYEVAICGYPCHYIFAITTSYSDVALISQRWYDTKEDAQLAADQLVLLGTLSESYHVAKTPDFTFEVVDDPGLYPRLAQDLVATSEATAERQEKFLNHLLARFSEQFADYSLILYEQRRSAGVQFFERKAAFLSQYDRLSRNRGKAFDYSKPYWQQDNMSGFKAQVLARLGKKGLINERACNFEVDDLGPEFQVVLRDVHAGLRAVSEQKFTSTDHAQEALLEFVEKFNEKQDIKILEDPANKYYSYQLRSASLFLTSTRSFSSALERDKHLLVDQTAIQTKPFADNILITQHLHFQELRNDSGEVIRRSKKSFPSQQLAESKLFTFTRRINSETRVSRPDEKLQLVVDPLNDLHFVDSAALKKYFLYEDFRYRWVISDAENLVHLKSSQSYETGELAGQALADILQNADTYTLASRVEGTDSMIVLQQGDNDIATTESLASAEAFEKQHILETIFDQNRDYRGIIQQKNRAYSWRLLDDEGKTILTGSRWSTNKRKAERDWRQSRLDKKYRLEIKLIEDDRSQVILYDQTGSISASSPKVKTKATQDLFNTIEERLKIKQNIQFEFQSEAFSYHIPDSKSPGAVLLESYQAFPSAGAALDALSKSLRQIKKTVDYYETGDEANLNYSFSVQDKQGRFVMTHPNTYATATERDLIMKHTQEEIQELRLPLLLRKESPFWLTDGQNRLLKSRHAFESSSDALQGMCHLVHRLRDDSSTRLTKSDKGYVINVYEQKQFIASSSPQDERYLRESVMERLKFIADEHFYHATTMAEPHRWAYRLFWENSQGIAEELIRSQSEFYSQKAAERAYQQLLDKIQSIRSVYNQNKNTLNFFAGKSRKSLGYYPNEIQEESAQTLIADATNYTGYLTKFQQQYDEGDLRSWIDQTPESQQGNYIYRLVKNQNPIAFAPCDCIVLDKVADDDHVHRYQDTLLDSYRKQWMGNYTYCDFCLAGDIVIKIGIRYHFVLRRRDTDAIMLVSVQSFDSRQVAIDAFNKHFFSVIGQASDAASYGTIIPLGDVAQNGNSHCADTQDTIVYVPKDCMSEFSAEKWARCFCSYPIRRCQLEEQKPTEKKCADADIQYKYYFHLLKQDSPTSEDCKIAWKSTKCYDTANEARIAFHLFKYILKNKESYYLFFDEEGVLSNQATKCCIEEYPEDHECCIYPAIREVLVNSRCRYHTRDQAWGRGDALAIFDSRFPTLEMASKELDLFGTCIEEVSGQLETGVIANEKKDQFTPVIYHVNRKLLAGTRHHPNEGEAQQVLDEILRLFHNPDNYIILRDPDCWYRLGIGKKVCPPPVCKTNARDLFLQPKGLQELFALGGSDAAFYTYPRHQDGHYSFHVVRKNFHLALHPYYYNTLDERNEKVLQLHRYWQHDQHTAWTINAQDIQGKFTGIVQDSSNQILIKSLASFDEPLDAIYDIMGVLEYLRDKNFYVHNPGGTLAISRLRNDNPGSHEKLLAEILLTGQSVDNWVEAALFYPLTLRDDGIGFQHYCPDFQVIDDDDTNKFDPCTMPQEPGYRSGAMIWTSRHSYSTLDEALCYYRHFLRLLQERMNYRPTQDTCGPFGIELVDPQAIVASHPQAYHLRSELEKAIERTQECLYTKGLHVVEHILLRPQKGQQEEQRICLLPAKPQPHCKLGYDPNDDFSEDHTPLAVPACPAEDNEAPVVTEDCKEERNEACYIPGSDPYSFLTTLVLPAYAPQFRSLSAREWLQNLLYESAPLHVGLNILWLDPKDMCRFEACYSRWLLEQRCAKQCRKSYSLCDFIRCFKGLRSCPALPEDDPEASCTTNMGQTVSISPFAWQSILHRSDDSLYSPSNLKQLMHVRGGQLSPKSAEEINVVDWEGYRPLCPEECDDDHADDGDVHSESGPTDWEQNAEMEQEIRKMMYHRKTGYLESLRAVANKNILRSSIYKRIVHFVEQGVNLQDFATLMQNIERQNAKLKKPLSEYAGPIAVAVHHILDRIFIGNMPIENMVIEITPNWMYLQREAIHTESILSAWSVADVSIPHLKERAEQLHHYLNKLT